MRHYSLEQWADFARNVAGPKEVLEMQQHLSDGCKKCPKILDLWRRVHRVAQKERQYEPPEATVRTVKGTFAIRGPRKAAGRSRLMARLLFDSRLSPLPAGVRSAAAIDRQLLYAVGNYNIDLRFEHQADSDKVVIVGQVLRSAGPTSDVGSVPVKLIRGRRVVAESVSSKFGEFRLECDLEGGFQLRISLPAEDLCVRLIEPGESTSEPGDSGKVI